MARLDAALGPLLGAVALAGVAWALVTPAWQAPDEPAHYAYVQSLSEDLALPDRSGERAYSTEVAASLDATRMRQVAGRPAVDPEASEAAWQRWKERAEAFTRADRADGGGSNPAADNPPLAYALLAPADRLLAEAGAGVLTRVAVLRMIDVGALLLAVWWTWVLALELLRDRRLALAAAAVVGLQPMASFVAASITPDGALMAAWAGGLLAGVRLLREGWTGRRAAALLAAAGAAALIKPAGLALVPAAALALGVALRRRGRAGMSARAWNLGWVALGAAAAAAVAFAAWQLTRPVGAQAAVGQEAVNLREAFSYLWQYYLPRLPFQTEVAATAGYGLPAYDVWLKTGWGAFGWLEVRWPVVLYALVAAALAAAAAGAAVAVWRRRPDPALLAFAVLAAGTLLAGLHVTEYRLIARDAGAFNQGRYLLPLLPLLGLAAGLALSLLRPGRRLAGAALVVAGLAGLQIVSLGLTFARFHA